MALLKTRNFVSLSATSTGGAAVAISDLESVFVMLSGTFVGTWFVDVSFDGGTTWGQFATGTEGSTLLTAQLPPATHARLRFTRTSGTLAGGLGGNLRAL